MTRKITLCAVPYEVTEQDGQVIFECRSGFAGLHSRFTFEWKGLGWYLVDTDATFGSIFLAHITAAAKWVEANYHIEWCQGKGVAYLKPEEPA